MNLSVQGSSIHYEIFGEGLPILIIHGFLEDQTVMKACMEPVFSELSGYQRIYIDLPGMGASIPSKELVNADKMVTIIQAFIEKVIGNNEYLLVGQSYGGYLALGITYLYPKQMKGLFLLCPCTVSNHQLRIVPEKPVVHVPQSLAIGPTEQTDFADFLDMAVIVTEETWKRYQQEILPGLKKANHEYLAMYQTKGYGFTFEADLKRLQFRHPVSILTGKQDTCVGYEDCYQLVKAFSSLNFSIIDGAGHNLQIEKPAFFELAMGEWLKEIKSNSLA